MCSRMYDPPSVNYCSPVITETQPDSHEQVSVLADVTTRQSSAMGVPLRMLLSRGVQSTSLANRVAVAASPSTQ